MKNDDWCKSETWNSSVEANFERELNSADDETKKLGFLYAQAVTLLRSSDKSIQPFGVRLMERLLSYYTKDYWDYYKASGQEHLGDYYFEINNFEIAEKYFRILSEYYITEEQRDWTNSLADLKLGETILLANLTNKFEEVYDICKNFPLEMDMYDYERFYYAALFAQICDKLHKLEEAKEFALKAIEIVKTIKNMENYYPERYKRFNPQSENLFGIVKATEKQFRTLKEIAKLPTTT